MKCRLGKSAIFLVHEMVALPQIALSEVVEAVAREIVAAEHSGSASIIKIPILYPSGSSVVVQVTQHGTRYFITDMGFGFQEAEMIGAGIQYSNSAKSSAEHFGIRFDNQAFFVAEADRAQLAAAVTIVANCSSEAAALAAYKTSERKFEEDADKLYHKLISAFPQSEVERDVDFMGSSTHKWPVAAVVRHEDKVAVFEPVSRESHFRGQHGSKIPRYRSSGAAANAHRCCQQKSRNGRIP